MCLPASTLVTLRRQYAYNMFDPPTAESMRIYENERDRFFDHYRYFEEMMCLREKWPFLGDVLATVYFTAAKKISLDQIFTLLEYRRVSSSALFSSVNENSLRHDLGSCDGELSRLSRVAVQRIGR